MFATSRKEITAVRGNSARKAAPATTHSKPKGDSHASVAKGSLKAVKEMKAIIIDIGTSYSKCGFAGDPWPSHIISSTVGKHIQDTAAKRKETFVGRELQNTSIPLELINPLRHGIVVDWNCVQDTWEYIFHTEMTIQPENNAVLVSDPPLSPTTNRAKYAEMMFEGFCVPAIHIAYQSRLSMYSYGRTSALGVESGHGVSYVVPIYEGYIMPSITGRVDYAGLDITCYLMKLLNESGNKFTDDQLSIVDLKEKYSYTSLDLAQDLRLPLKKQQLDYELPDGQIITIGKERFLCAEALFSPALLSSQEPGLSQLTMTHLKKCDADLKRRLVGNILLCGGSTMMAGFADPFQSELAWMCPNDHFTIAASPQRMSSVWIGGSILASLQSFQELWVYRREYEEHGPSCIFNKCF